MRKAVRTAACSASRVTIQSEIFVNDLVRTLWAWHLIGVSHDMHTAERPAPSRNPSVAPASDRKAMKIMARSLFKDMVANGLSHQQIIEVASSLLAEVTDELKTGPSPRGRA